MRGVGCAGGSKPNVYEALDFIPLDRDALIDVFEMRSAEESVSVKDSPYPTELNSSRRDVDVCRITEGGLRFVPIE